MLSSNWITKWSNEDTFMYIHKRKLLGVRTLNKLSNIEFQSKLCEYLKYIKKVKIDGKELYWKHDINNGLFTLLQLNENLLEEKYNLITSMREKLWFIDEEDYIEHDKIVNIILSV